MTVIPFVLYGFIALGLASTVRNLWKAVRTGEIDEDVWLGASNADDHYGFVIRVIGLLAMLGILIWFGSQVPDITAALERS